MLEALYILLPLLLFLILLYLVRLAVRFVRAVERIADSVHRSGLLSRTAHNTLHDTNIRQ